jgi:hypothetical protein
MKKNPLIPWLVLLAPATIGVGGCFSALVRSGQGWAGTKTSTGTKVAAGMADLVTLPLQAPAIALAGAGEIRRKSHLAKREELLKQIKANPEYIFQHKLHFAEYYDGSEAVCYALWDHSINFSDAQLRRLYKEMDWQRVYVLGNPHCSVEFLRQIWDPINSSAAFADWQIMEQLVRNPSLPAAWLEIIAGDEKKFGSSSGIAKEFLRRRKMSGRAPGPGQAVTC